MVTRVMAVAVGTMGTGGMAAISRKIVRDVMTEIDAMFAPQTDQCQDELADEDRAADHRAKQKE